ILDTVPLLKLATHIRVPSNAIFLGVSPTVMGLPTNAPVAGLIRDTVLLSYDTQTLVPSKATPAGHTPVANGPVTVLVSVLIFITPPELRWSLTQMLVPSKAIRNGAMPGKLSVAG